jgi:hypothetical protein
LKRKYVLLIALLTIAAIFVVLYFAIMFPYEKSKSITRITDNPAEENALQAAENINCTDIFKIPRATPSDLSDYWDKTVAHYIDSEVIEYFEVKFERLRVTPYGVILNYTANVSVWDGIQITYIPPPENESIYSAKVRILNSNGLVLREIRGGNAHYAWRNASGIYEGQESELDFEFRSCYFVEMELRYGETYANTGAYFFHIIQTVVIDENLNPLLISLQKYGGVA